MRYITYLSISFVLVGILLGSMYRYIFIKEVEFLSNSIPTVGKIIGTKDCSGRKTSTHCAVLQFTNNQGVVVDATLSASENWYNKFKIGDTENIIYSGAKMLVVQTNSFHSKWGATLGIAIMGIIFFLIGTLAGVYSFKTRK